MQYDDVIAAFFQPSPAGAEAGPTLDSSPARRFRDAIEPIAMHSVWSRTTNEAQAALGLDFMTGYVMGRASLMGQPEPGVVAAAFAVFEPAMVQGAYEAARGLCDRDELWATRTKATTASLTEVLDGADVTAVADALQAAVSSASLVGRPLFAGLVGQEWPSDPVGRLWRACELAREHRGDSHVAVCVANGLDPIEMNILTEIWVGMPIGSYTATRGWSPEDIAATVERMREKDWLEGDGLSQEGAAFRGAIEEDTDMLTQSIIDSLGDSFDDVVGSLEAWSQLCINAKAFPPDVFKRAAG